MSAMLEQYSPTHSEADEAAKAEDGGRPQGSTYSKEDPGVPDRQPAVEKGALPVQAETPRKTETPRRTRRGHSPAPLFPPSFNYHVSTEHGRGGNGDRWSDSLGGTWHSCVPDVTMPKKPELRWMEEDLETAMFHLFGITPDRLEVEERTVKQPEKPEPAERKEKQPEKPEQEAVKQDFLLSWHSQVNIGTPHSNWPYYQNRRTRKPHQPRMEAASKDIVEINVGYEELFDASPENDPSVSPSRGAPVRTYTNRPPDRQRPRSTQEHRDTPDLPGQDEKIVGTRRGRDGEVVLKDRNSMLAHRKGKPHPVQQQRLRDKETKARTEGHGRSEHLRPDKIKMKYDVRFRDMNKKKKMRPEQCRFPDLGGLEYTPAKFGTHYYDNGQTKLETDKNYCEKFDVWTKSRDQWLIHKEGANHKKTFAKAQRYRRDLCRTGIPSQDTPDNHKRRKEKGDTADMEEFGFKTGPGKTDKVFSRWRNRSAGRPRRNRLQKLRRNRLQELRHTAERSRDKTEAAEKRTADLLSPSRGDNRYIREEMGSAAHCLCDCSCIRSFSSFLISTPDKAKTLRILKRLKPAQKDKLTRKRANIIHLHEPLTTDVETLDEEGETAQKGQ